MMADHHKGYGVPIGGVIAHETLVSPSGVGYDIGCGNKAVLTDAAAADVRANIARITDDVWNTISFGLARKNKEPVDPNSSLTTTMMLGRSPKVRTAPRGS